MNCKNCGHPDYYHHSNSGLCMADKENSGCNCDCNSCADCEYIETCFCQKFEEQK